MHPSSEYTARLFFENYVSNVTPLRIGEVGAGGDTYIRNLVPKNSVFVSLDSDQGVGADVFLEDPYTFPVESNSVDIIVSSSCFEHSEMFWLTFNEIMRVLKPGGLFYLNAPSAGAWHRYPVDCWRFYPDSGNALVKWAQRSGYNDAALVESFHCHYDTHWHDYVAVFIKDKNNIELHPNRILDKIELNFISNGSLFGSSAVINEDTNFEKHRGIFQK
jgi:SAM-dependent methyltransferase